jgi:hypothetical protein
VSLPDIVAIGADGQIVAGPIPRRETPWLVGADGTLYAAEFGSPSSPSKLVALSPELAELWTIDIPSAMPYGTSAVLGDDGVLYTQIGTVDGSAVIAIQTKSPGLARSSWPTYRHDNRSTNWAGGQF